MPEARLVPRPAAQRTSAAKLVQRPTRNHNVGPPMSSPHPPDVNGVKAEDDPLRHSDRRCQGLIHTRFIREFWYGYAGYNGKPRTRQLALPLEAEPPRYLSAR